MRLPSKSPSKEQNWLLPPGSCCSFHWQEEAGTEKWLQSALTAFHILSGTRMWSVRIPQAWKSVFSCSTEWHRESLSRKEVWPCWHSGRYHCFSWFSARMWCHHYWWCCSCTLSLSPNTSKTIEEYAVRNVVPKIWRYLSKYEWTDLCLMSTRLQASRRKRDRSEAKEIGVEWQTKPSCHPSGLAFSETVKIRQNCLSI